MSAEYNDRETLWVTLRDKWRLLPAGTRRIPSRDLLVLTDEELLERWQQLRAEASQGEAFAVRGWYHLLYRDILHGKRVLDVGSGLGLDALTFAEHGARVSCLDIVAGNLELLRRLAGLLGLDSVDFVYMDGLTNLSELSGSYDVIWCQGSLLHVPFEVAREEARRLLEHMPVGGRWVELAYPRTRWERDGKPAFERWGDFTDGGAPWVEWYDLEKLLARLEPARFEVVLAFDFHQDDFNWFDLVRTA